MFLPVFVQKTALLSLNQFQSRSSRRRRRLQLTIPLQDYRPVAGIPPGASPASSWVESQPNYPPLLTSTHLWTHLFFFFFSNKEPRPICLYRRNPIWCPTDTSFLHNPKCIVLIPLFWKLFCTVFIVCLFWQKHFMYFYVYDSKSAFAPPCIALDLGYKDHISHINKVIN